MSTEQNRALANRVVKEVINTGNFDRFVDYFSPNYVEHTPLPSPDYPTGAEGFKRFFGDMRAAFPDFQYKVESTLAEGDKIVQHLTGSGTMMGTFLGLPATGKRAQWSEIHTARVGPDGKFAEHWANVDQLGMMTQLGLAQPPGGM